MSSSPAQVVFSLSQQLTVGASSSSCFEPVNIFGPFSQCRFDFTLLFEQTTLSCIPALIFLFVSPFRIYYLWRQDQTTVKNQMTNIKLYLNIASLLLQLGMLVSWSLLASSRTIASIPSTLLNLLAVLAILPLSYLENDHSIKPSTILNIYLLFSAVLDLPQFRTLYIRDDNVIIARIFGGTLLLKLTLLVIEGRSRSGFLKPQYQQLSPEATSGIINHSLFWWLNDLFQKGSHTILTLEDLYDLEPYLGAENVGGKLREAWNRRSEGRFALAHATWRAFRRQFAYTVFPRLCLLALIFTQPFLISSILSLLDKPDNERSRSEGHGLILAMGLVMIGIAISMVHSSYSLFRFTTMFRGGMIALIYERTLLLKDGVFEESAAVSLMSNDVDQISGCLREMNEIWSRALEIAIGLPLLTRQLGWVSIIPLIVVIGPFYGAGLIAKLISTRQRLWGDATQKRLGVTNSMLRDMASLKMMGLNEVVGETVQNERVAETKKMEKWAWIKVWQNVIANIPYVIAPAATFGAYAIQAYIQGTESLNTVKAFTSLALITLVSYPTTRLLAAIPNTAASIGCFDRIQKFLLVESRVDQRTHLDIFDGNTLSGNGQKLVSGSNTFKGHPDTTMLKIEDANFRPAVGTNIVLRNISIHVRVGTVNMITGPVGAGKTILLKAILGELPSEGGTVYIKSKRIAYCSQTPWLQSGSIRKTIIGIVSEKFVDEVWYNTVIDACALSYDISKFPKRDHTIIGSRGVTLSGGQKHRLALARALYSKCDILVLDDILSALDMRTEKIIVDKLFGSKGLFKKYGSTVIMVTHATQYLPLANQVIVIPGPGQHITQGKYQDIEQSGLLAGLVDDDISSKDSSDDSKDEDVMTEAADSIAAQDLKRQTGDVTIYMYYVAIKTSTDVQQADTKVSNQLKSIGVAPLIVFIAFVLLQTFSGAFSKIWLKWWTDVEGTQAGLYISVYFLLGIGYVAGIGGYAWACAVWIGGSTGRKLHRVLLDTVLRAPLSFFSQTQTGSILSRFSQDMTLIEGQLATGLLITFSNLCAAIGAAALLATGSPLVSLTAPFFVVFVYFLQRIYLRTSRQLRYLDLETRGPLYSHFLETLEGLSTIRAFGWEKEFSETNIRLLDDSQKPYYLLLCIQRWLSLVLDLMSAAMAVLVVGLAITFRKWTEPGLLGVSMNSTLNFNASLSQFIGGWTMLETSLGAVSRLRSFEKETPIEAKPGEDTEPPAIWPSKGLIEIKNVTVYHNPSAPALKNISLVILPGQKVGICGRTGSGKSTLLSTLLRTLDIASGSISIDGIDLSTLPRTTIRHRITTISQSPLHLPGTLRQTLDPFSIFPDTSLIHALESVHLYSIFLSRSPSPLSSPFLPDSLSKGQNQLLCLARAILQKNQIVLLDEATSSVDTKTDEVLKQVINEEFGGRTLVSVAHRRETILGQDMIVLLEGGEIVEVGVPGELINRESKLRELLGGPSSGNDMVGHR